MSRHRCALRKLPVGQNLLYEIQKLCFDERIPPHFGGALRAIVTTREAGSGGRDVPQRVLTDARTNGMART